MDIKVTGTVKYGGKWYGPNEVINDVEEAEGERIVKISAGIKVEKTHEQISAEEAAAAKAKAEAEEAERKAVEEKARKDAEKQLKALRKKAAELGIDGADEKDAETLTAEIAAKEQK
ncbi:hypothetical protein [Paenibacillus rubinfantis]|uniref:hypothetical protein n=1 Tax=Paenibacillus rubinfantis TaxID=1720296 RepID=UPI00073EBB1D|nr:hypothetical protein [Paenibacillus rubinfantis]